MNMGTVTFCIAKGIDAKDFKSAKTILTACGAEFNWDAKTWTLTAEAAAKNYPGAMGGFGPQLSLNLTRWIKCGDIIVENGAELIQSKGDVVYIAA